MQPGADFPGALLRLDAHDLDWVEHLPPVPAGHTVTVSLSDEAVTGAPALADLGYHVLGILPGDSRGCAYAVVGQRLLETHPTWWQALLANAAAAYSPATGPVQLQFADLLAAHQEARVPVRALMAQPPSPPSARSRPATA